MLSGPFAARELNGEMLLQEATTLRDRGVSADALGACALGLARAGPQQARELVDAVGHLAATSSRCPAPLARLMEGWATKVKSEEDVVAYVDHFLRLARVFALIPALLQSSERLAKGL
jgi:hypothetical protein